MDFSHVLNHFLGCVMHFASYYRLLVYQHLFGPPDPNATLLDIGCDDGGFIARMPVRMSVAMDREIDALRKVSGSACVCGDGTHMPFQEVMFDHIVLSDVIEHVEDDQTLVKNATDRVKPGGVLWLSTTAIDFKLFPAQITTRAECSWGHVRKGYTSEQLTTLIGYDFACDVIKWPERMFRHIYLVMWILSKRTPKLACILAHLCFLVDRILVSGQAQHGHLYVQARRRRAANSAS